MEMKAYAFIGLTGQEIEAVANSVIKKLTKTIGADVRNG